MYSDSVTSFISVLSLQTFIHSFIVHHCCQPLMSVVKMTTNDTIRYDRRV